MDALADHAVDPIEAAVRAAIDPFVRDGRAELHVRAHDRGAARQLDVTPVQRAAAPFSIVRQGP